MQRCVALAKNKELAKAAMHQCDKSMSLLVGSQTSLGTLRAITDVVEEKGTDYMPGKCCFDSPTNHESYFGMEVSPTVCDVTLCDSSFFFTSLSLDFDFLYLFQYDPHLMECTNPGPFHLGISEEACENAGGKWFRYAQPYVLWLSCQQPSVLSSLLFKNPPTPP